jgi:hypothetical protein
MTTADEDKGKDRHSDEEIELAKETIEDLDPSTEEERDVKGGSQGPNTRAVDCQANTNTCNCSI